MHVHATSRHFLTHLTKANQGNSKSENDVTVKKIVVYIFIYIVLNNKFMTYDIESCYLKARMSFLAQLAFCVF